MKRDDSVYLRHIRDAIAKIEAYLADVSESDFYKHSMVQDAVIRQLEIIGEAVRHISEELQNAHSEIPWQDIAGMRNKLIHDYFGVDIEKVWLTATEDIARLKAEVLRILQES